MTSSASVDHATGAVLVQENVSEKHNEITYFKPLLEGIKNLRGVVVTADALHTQREHAEYLHSREAHFYLHSREAHFAFTVKANQPKLHDQLRALPWKRVRAGNKTRESANGREIERTIKCVGLADGIKFPHAVQGAQITRKSRPIGTRAWSTETVYIVTSLTPAQGKPELIGALIRGHWGIENGLHWRRDVTWREDGSQVRRGNTPRVMVRWRRAMILLASAGGNTVPAVAALVAADEDTVREVIYRFNEIGSDCLDPHWGGGRPHLLSPEEPRTRCQDGTDPPTKTGTTFHPLVGAQTRRLPPPGRLTPCLSRKGGVACLAAPEPDHLPTPHHVEGIH